MTASLTEALMGLGELTLDLEYDPEVLAELVRYRHILLYWGEEAIALDVLLSRTPSRGGVTIRGRGADWWLGQDGDGPVILDREYLSGRSRLSNGDFELAQSFWRRAESTAWVIGASHVRAGNRAARTISDPVGRDDILQADEAQDTRLGDEWQLDLWAQRFIGDVGRLRARLVFEGRFADVNLVTDPSFELGTGWTDISETATDIDIIEDAALARTGSWVLRLGPNARKELLGNGDFETGDFDYWDPGSQWAVLGTDQRGGNYGATWDAAAGSGSTLWASDEVDGSSVTFAVVPGERYHAEGYFRSDDIDPADGEIRIDITRLDIAPDPLGISELPHIRPNASGDIIWRKCEGDFEIDADTAYVALAVQNSSTVGKWRTDDFSLRRVQGNVAKIQGEPFVVTPQRTYKLTAVLRNGANLQSGSIKAVVTFSATGRPDISVESPAVDKAGLAALDIADDWRQWEFSFTPPSGYDEALLTFIATDVVGDSFYVDDVSIVDSDLTTRVFDVKSPETQADYAELTQTVAAPDGAERVRLELVAEDQGGGWAVDDISLVRVDAAPAVSGDVVRDLLLDPETGLSLLEPGQIHGTDTLLYDRHIINQTNRDELKHLSRSGIVSPTREWRVNPDFTLDWGTAAQLFADRTEIVLASGDVVLLDDPQVEQTAEDRVDKVILIGAETQLANGRRVLIVGEAENAAGGQDFYGNPVHRVRVVEDSTVTRRGYADGLARYHLDQVGTEQETVPLRLADWRALGRFDVGDWIYVWVPEAGLEDLDNPVEVDGRTTFPKRVRVLTRTWTLGSGPFRAELRRPDGSTLELPVRWDDTTMAEITVGDILPEFLVDPQGGPAFLQFKRFRASRPQ